MFVNVSACPHPEPAQPGSIDQAHASLRLLRGLVLNSTLSSLRYVLWPSYSTSLSLSFRECCVPRGGCES